MTFEDFMNRAWNEHGTHAQDVANRLPEAAVLATNADQIAKLAHLMGHLYGEHLGQWREGLKALGALKYHAAFSDEAAPALVRNLAALELASGQSQALTDLSLSDQLRVAAMAAVAVLAQGDYKRATQLFDDAKLLSTRGLVESDPANRSLAATANNIAATLEEKPELNAAESALMLDAARVARIFWEKAGGWLEVERAEYRLALSNLKAKQLQLAREHARRALKIIEDNKAEALEYFFAYEAQALIENAQNDAAAVCKAVNHAELYFEKLSADDRGWCEPILNKLAALR